MIHKYLESAEITADIVIFVVFIIGSYYYDSLLNSKNLICSRVNITSPGCKIY